MASAHSATDGMQLHWHSEPFNIHVMTVREDSSPNKCRGHIKVGSGILLQVQAAAMQPALQLSPCKNTDI